MDKERARFILSCFRPDGADAADPDFAAALQLAVEDRELGEWLARERAQDAAFAAALGQVEIPNQLRDEILSSFAIERGDLPQADDPTDTAFIGALASLRPPDGLRDQILAAMERSATKRKVVPFRRLAVAVAAAAAIVLGLFLTRDAAHGAKRLPMAAVEAGFLQMYGDPSFSLEMANADHQALFDHLKQESVPCPCPGTMPPGLAGVEGVGCRVLEIEGHRGSLVCFDERSAGVVHLLVFYREDVAGEFPGPADPTIEQHGKWAVARWASDERVFMLLGATEVNRLAGLF